MKVEELFCHHTKIKVTKTESTTYINCAMCFGYLTQFKNDVPESKNFDWLLARRLYVFGPVYELSDEQRRRWV